MHLDIAVGEAKVDEQGEKEHVHDLAEKMSDLNKRLNDIRKEQQYQREREAEFRDLSEATNSRAVWWSVIQLCVLFGACAWQLRHLKVSRARIRQHSEITLLIVGAFTLFRNFSTRYFRLL